MIDIPKTHHKTHPSNSVTRVPFEGIFVGVPLLLLLLDVILVLWKIRLIDFQSDTPWEYTKFIWTAAASVVAVAAALVLAYRGVVAVIGGKTLKKSASIEAVIVASVQIATRPLRKPRWSVLTTIGLLIFAVYAWEFGIVIAPASASASILFTNDETVGLNGQKYIYLAAPDGTIERMNPDGRGHIVALSLRQQGDPAPRVTADSLLEFDNGSLRLLFVADMANRMVHIVDVTRGAFSEISPGLPIGGTPRSMTATPDGRKLFVSFDQPITAPGIAVFDVQGDRPQDFHRISTITGVHCPEGMVISPNGRRLYVATQCGGGTDPVYVIDTASYAVKATIPDLAVGVSVAINRAGDRLYVGRGNYPCTLRNSQGTGSPVSVVDLNKNVVLRTICLHTSVGPIAATLDHNVQYVAVANGNYLSVFQAREMESSKSSPIFIALDAGVSGIASDGTGALYVYKPDSRQQPLFFLYPSGFNSRSHL
jgi:YVTN family beta-propeller protein